ncbi:MAG TPA: hypothetical protein VH186_26265 [Chloroflexia bacterium]|nr:hypothetical protein [Chloroflexia bacterium]
MAQRPTSSPSSNVGNIGHHEKREGKRVILYIAVVIVLILIIGFLAGALDSALRSSVQSNAFLDNSREILAVIASTAPWIAFFIILCSSWIVIAEQLFVRWNRAIGGEQDKDKGVIYEIVEDNNAAAALVLLVPMIIIAMGLIYVALLNLPFNIPTVVTSPGK